ncbi:hypothetical protein [Mycobacterium sp. RTGN5]|uniref:hypothetical protein n=1 Tax=Mycobacterium sp. RTGN5 TaxID=3016522 RepID=UPI0029C92BF4|nr:hypothetical protein [Mycobacterium sp. RTGN5]
MVRLDPHAAWRLSKRGLLLAGSNGDTVLLEHPRAGQLPAMLADDPDPGQLQQRLGPPMQPGLVGDLIAQGILTDIPADAGAPRPAGTPSGWAITRSGLMIGGVQRPARWLDRRLLPLVLHPVGRFATGLIVVGGLVALLAGRPDLPAASDTPLVEALAMIVLGLAATACHELGHAVALVHYDRVPRRAGFGFYWGAVSFFVDSTAALTLPRRARVVQALAGLMVDTVTTALFAIAAQLASSTLWAIVFWRLAILSIVDMMINLAPVLQVDGHWALADWLDEPDLAIRARAALGAALRRRPHPGQRWLATYGAVSLVAGVGLLAVMVTVFWANAGALVVNLFSGGAAEIAIGVYYVAPVTLGILFSLAGLLMETAVPVSRHQ